MNNDDKIVELDSPRNTQLERTKREMLDRLAEVGGRLTAEEDIVFSGTKLVLPEKMQLREAIRFLEQKHSEDERAMQFHQVFKFRPWDGARAASRALRKAFGLYGQKAQIHQGFFGPEEEPPHLITINVGVNETEQVPWGDLVVPHLPGLTLTLEMTKHPELGVLFQITGEGPRKYRHHVQGIFNLIEDELRSESLYRGRAFDGQSMPEFLDLRGVDPGQVIYSDEVTTQLEANVWSLLRYTPRMRQLGVPLKRAVLLEGPFGTGKTLGAYLTAQVATQNGWTFVYCRPTKDDIGEVIGTARLYQPSVVFFEDVDAIASPEVGHDKVGGLLDIFDGLQSKGTEIVAVLTTNHVDRIHKAMIRPGRLDAVVHIGALDVHGPERMAKATVPAELIDPEVDWELVGKAMEDFLPAFVREALDRTVRYSLARNEGRATVLTTEDFVYAAEGLRPQLELMESAEDTHRPEPLGEALERTVRDAVHGADVVRGDHGLRIVTKEQ